MIAIILRDTQVTWRLFTVHHTLLWKGDTAFGLGLGYLDYNYTTHSPTMTFWASIGSVSRFQIGGSCVNHLLAWLSTLNMILYWWLFVASQDKTTLYSMQ